MVIDNNIDPDCWGAEDLAGYARRVKGSQVHVRRAPQQDLPKNPADFDRIVISGSKACALDTEAWIERLIEFIGNFLVLQRPILGVCYGHQTLARVLGGIGSVRKSRTPELGWSEIEVLKSNPLMRGLSDRFHTFSSHFDEVYPLPESLIQLARSPRCEIQAYQLKDRPVFGIQFHPEKSLEGAIRSLAQRMKVGDSKILLRPKESQKLYNPKVGETIFRNFFQC